MPRPTRRSSGAALAPATRLLAAADELFYEEGVHTVGIDRIIERAGVAKASLYNTFGSKDELVRAYLAARQDARQARILDRIARFTTPRERLLGVFDALGELFAEPGFRGCAFMNASAECSPAAAVEEGMRRLPRLDPRALRPSWPARPGVARPGRARRPAGAALRRRHVSARMDRDPKAAAWRARWPTTLLDAALAA